MIQVQLKLRPTKAQARQLEHWLWHLTAIWNWAIRLIEQDRPGRWTTYDMKARLNGHSKKLGIPTGVIQGTAATAVEAWQRHSRGLAGRPRLKGRRRRLSSIACTHWDIGGASRIRGWRALVPGLGLVRFHRQDIPPGHVGSARIVRRASGWYLCLFVHAEPKNIPVVANGEVGIDPGFSSLLTFSTGEKIDRAQEWQRGEQRLSQAKRGHRKQLSARLQERIAHCRKDRNHKLSRRLVAENALIAFSADQHSNIARSFGKSVSSAGHHQLRRQLTYKSRAGGREYVEVSPRNSTRACSACRALTGPTGWRGLKVRQWTCGACGAQHDRDVNAAVNTLIAGRGARHEHRRKAASGIAAHVTPRSSIAHGRTPVRKVLVPRVSVKVNPDASS